MAPHIIILYCLAIASIITNLVCLRRIDYFHEKDLKYIIDISDCVDDVRLEDVHIVKHSKEVLDASKELLEVTKSVNNNCQEVIDNTKTLLRGLEERYSNDDGK